jgi:hypothetical protein
VAKKRHCVKNILICNASHLILYMSETYEGSVHDKIIADEADFTFEKVIDILQDTGGRHSVFQGFKPKNSQIIQPVKKPKGKQLTDEQKEQNRQIAKVRVVIEQAIGGVKIWRVVKETCRSWIVSVTS